MFQRLCAAALVASLVAAQAAAQPAPPAASAVPPMPSHGSFALIGDTPYGASRVPQFDRVIDDINATPRVRFVLHTGDIKAGSERCDDSLFLERFAQFQRLDKPFVLTPGDNEWTDCHRDSNGNYHPLERLTRLRQIFYPQPGVTTGARPARVDSQAAVPAHAEYVENTMWRFGGAVIGTLHVVGSQNDLAPWDQIDPTDSVAQPRPDRLAEFEARQAAALAWIDTLFDAAEREAAAGVLVAMQANPNLELPAGDPARLGFEAVLERLTVRAMAFGKPVVVAHGDSHYFRVDKPLSAPTASGGFEMLENVTRVENFGSQHVHWVEVTVSDRDPNVFGFRQHLIDANRFPR